MTQSKILEPDALAALGDSKDSSYLETMIIRMEEMEVRTAWGCQLQLAAGGWPRLRWSISSSSSRFGSFSPSESHGADFEG